MASGVSEANEAQHQTTGRAEIFLLLLVPGGPTRRRPL